MNHRVVSASAAAALALALLPGNAAAAMPGSLDQNVTQTGTYLTDLITVTQTFTAGTSGALTHVELYCQGDISSVSVDLYVGMTFAGNGSCGAAAGWVDFILPQSQLLAAGFTGILRVVGGGSPYHIGTGDYAGGAAGDQNGDPLAGVSDFAFRTYVLPLQTITGIWAPPSVPAGVSTPVTLTFTTQFPAVSSNPITPPVGYSFSLTALPAYFTPTGITCSAPISAGSCDLAILQGPTGIQASANGDPLTVTITISGTLLPPAGEAGESISVQLGACLGADDEGDPPRVSMCNYVDAGLRIGRAATAPPTTEAGDSGSSSGGLPLWWLPIGLIALLSSLLVVGRQTKTVRQPR